MTKTERETIPEYFQRAKYHLTHKNKRQSQAARLMAGKNDHELLGIEDFAVCERITNRGDYCSKMQKLSKNAGFERDHFQSTGSCKDKDVYSLLRSCCMDVYGINTGPKNASICDFYNPENPRDNDFLWEGCCKRKNNVVLIVTFILIAILAIYILMRLSV